METHRLSEEYMVIARAGTNTLYIKPSSPIFRALYHQIQSLIRSLDHGSYEEVLLSGAGLLGNSERRMGLVNKDTPRYRHLSHGFYFCVHRSFMSQGKDINIHQTRTKP